MQTPTLASTQPAPGVNKPAFTATSIDIRQRMADAETARLADAEARYAAALRGASNGDQKAIEALIVATGELGLTAEDVGHDRHVIETIQAVAVIEAAWTPEKSQEFERRSKEIAAHNQRNPVAEHKQQRVTMERDRSRLLTEYEKVQRAKKELAELLQQPRARALHALTGGE